MLKLFQLQVNDSKNLNFSLNFRKQWSLREYIKILKKTFKEKRILHQGKKEKQKQQKKPVGWPEEMLNGFLNFIFFPFYGVYWGDTG